MALKTPYATAAESDVFLADRADWLALTDAVKDKHLLNATYYMDSKYTCTFTDPIQDEAGYACSLLAYHDFVKSIFTVDKSDGGIVTAKEVEADGVRSKVQYSGNFSSSSFGSIDLYPDVTSVLGGICYLNKGRGLSQVKVTR